MTILRSGGLLAGLVLSALATVCWAPDARSEGVKIVNLMPKFLALQDEVQKLQRADLFLRGFHEQIIDPNRDIYSKLEFKDAITDEGLVSYFNEVSDDVPQIRALSAEIEQRTQEVVSRFKQQFPRFDERMTIVFLPSLYRVDAQYTRVLDQPMLLLGVDAIARFRRSDTAFAVLLTHELFHAHHERTNKSLYREDPMPLFARIWIEGLAAHASASLNPQATRPEILGDVIAAVDRNPAPVPAGPAVDMLRARLNSVDPADQAKFLTYTAGIGSPKGSGYWMGYEIAKALSEEMPLADMASLRGSRLRSLMSKELEKMSAAYLAKQGAGTSQLAPAQTAESFPK